MSKQTKTRAERKKQRTVDIVERLDPRWSLITIMAVGLGLRLFFMKYRFAVAFDEVNYLKLGVSGYLNGLSDVLHTYWSPLLPTVISIVCAFFSDYELAGRMVSILSGTLLIVPVYFLGKHIYDKHVGILAAGFVALFPPLAFQSTQALTEPLYMLLATFAVLFGMFMLKIYSTGFAFLAGIASGLVYLAHPQGIGFLIVVAFWIVFGAVSKLFLIKSLRIPWLAALLVLGFLIVSLPYLIYLKNVTGKWTLSAKAAANWQMEAPKQEKGRDAFRSLDPTNRHVPIDRIFHQGDFLQPTNGVSKPVREVRLKPFLFKYVKNVTNMLSSAIPELLTTVPFLLLGVGLLGGPWKPLQGRMILYLLSFIAFFWFVVIPAFHLNQRYLTPLWPVCAIWVAKGALHIKDWLSLNMPVIKRSKQFKMAPGTLASVFIFAIFFIASFLPEFGRVVARQPDNKAYWADPVEQKRAGLWLKEHATAQKIIMSRNHAVDFYAGNYDIKQSVTIPKSSFERVLEYAKHRGVNYLVLNERYKESYADLRFLLETDNEVPGLKLVYEDKDINGLVTKIYRVL
ncbi:hypothetical protein GWO43_21625 [candidate division KSB1 bacterium]|nr:hypothetical protein [candidate division KSB1 bacterium]NIR72193.1 hypothetical protein [candidate division KSB1 bacterium]NIS26658.1 hypothetical protein [candidate division KSB1 bacterium]NIT73426.1 hypothetical protein [candidate division KSB1 bacterium]NIU27274.1 hypothetical protein [candidate division KSB1 bacterium]